MKELFVYYFAVSLLSVNVNASIGKIQKSMQIKQCFGKVNI